MKAINHYTAWYTKRAEPTFDFLSKGAEKEALPK